MKDAKLVTRLDPDHRSTVKVGDSLIGSNKVFLAAGPCAVESADQMHRSAEALKSMPVQAIRGCVFKPRTSPYSFQGLGEEGLDLLKDLKKRHGMPVVTEVMSEDQLNSAAPVSDIVQIGSRNMQNFELLKAVGRSGIPVILKRGLQATIEEFLMAAEYIACHGNLSIILCERGIRSFDSFTRNVLDLGAVVALRQLSHLPVIVDPSHAAGKRELVASLARAAVACGADGLLIECHPEPEKSTSDARQALSLESMGELVQSLRPVAAAVGRKVIAQGPMADLHSSPDLASQSFNSSRLLSPAIFAGERP